MRDSEYINRTAALLDVEAHDSVEAIFEHVEIEITLLQTFAQSILRELGIEPDDYQDDIDGALTKALEAIRALQAPVTVQIGIEGGVVQSATADCACDVIVYDYDDNDDNETVPAGDGETASAWRYDVSAEVDPAWIGRVHAQSMLNDQED